MVTAAIIIFTFAAMGGVIVAVGHRPNYRPPKWLAYGHGAAAVTGIVLLGIAAFTTPEAMGTGGL